MAKIKKPVLDAIERTSARKRYTIISVANPPPSGKQGRMVFAKDNKTGQLVSWYINSKGRKIKMVDVSKKIGSNTPAYRIEVT